MKKCLALIAILMLSTTANAAPILFDFESTAVGFYSSLVVTQGGVTATITRSSGSNLRVSDISTFLGAPGSFGSRTLNNFGSGHPAGDVYRVNFSETIDMVQIEFGDFGEDNDSPVTLRSFSGLDGTGTLVDSAAMSWDLDFGSGDSPGTLVNSGAGIQSIEFSAEGNNAGFLNSLYWDNLWVNTASVVPPPPPAVPEPTSALIFGCIAFCPLLRRRSSWA